jgi:hypothetical protein
MEQEKFWNTDKFKGGTSWFDYHTAVSESSDKSKKYEPSNSRRVYHAK